MTDLEIIQAIGLYIVIPICTSVIIGEVIQYLMNRSRK